ncbi:MAG: hypothetical protein F6K54_34670 [Okeania sp. SIO3B5]|uniref:hypothetical protein n=1 Tax=Okeania sp. SIO3B5 TaxID=2607811 RepID=UPI0013FE9BCA|nr:hypothetical protein [Okeania sp. SIO3B5]NEO57758.1 hypothetical protein [Okeania sp. SIO3B5]
MDEHQIDESSPDLETEESPNGSLATNTESANEDDKDNLVTKIKSLARGGITFVTNRFGAVTAFPLMTFNGITTTIGANKILPYGTGIVVGFILSIIYFSIVVFIEIKQEHPLRRFLLILIFCIGSIYTSFFAIYNQLSEGQLKYQSVTKTVIAHNQFINDLRTSLKQTINNIEKENPNIGTVNLLKQEIDEFRQKREEAKDKDGKGEIAEQIKKRNDRLQNISPVELPYEHQVHQNLNQLKESQLNSYLSVEEFIESNQSFSELFAKDDSLFRNLKEKLENIQEFDSDLLGKNSFQAPNYDNYVKTPTFLVPLEILLNPNSKRQTSFVIFAITVSIFLEVIPLLLGGIQTEFKGKENNVKEDIKNDNEPNKTTLGEFSSSISTLIKNIKETTIEILSALTEPIGTTKNLQDEIKNKLTQSMSAVGLNDQEKKDFLLFFYRNIDMEDKKIAVKQTCNSDSKVNQKSEEDKSESVQQSDASGNEDSKELDQEQNKLKMYEDATALIVDLMQNTRVKWLTKRSTPNTWLTQPLTLLPDKGCYHFSDSKKYQEFLAWLLDELTKSEVKPTKNSDYIRTSLGLELEYEINQEWKPSLINFPIEQSEK